MKLRFSILGLVFLMFACGSDDDGFFIPPTGGGSTGGGNNQALGAKANALLSANNFSVLDVQIHYMPGMEPNEDALVRLDTFLSGILNKPNGIITRIEEIPSGNQTKYTLGELRDIEDNERTAFERGDTIAAYFLYLDGSFDLGEEEEGIVLGVAHRSTSMALFYSDIQDNSGGIGQPSRQKLETSVLNHEFGHILGLVNVGTNMVIDHEDDAHPGHCNVEDCLMYFAVETGNIMENLMTNDVPQLDSFCRQDLIANGGK